MRVLCDGWLIYPLVSADSDNLAKLEEIQLKQNSSHIPQKYDSCIFRTIFRHDSHPAKRLLTLKKRGIMVLLGFYHHNHLPGAAAK